MSNTDVAKATGKSEHSPASLEDLLERFAVDMMSAQQSMDRENALERDDYALGLGHASTALAPLLRQILPPRALLAEATFEFSVSTKFTKTVSGGLEARLLSNIEVAGYESGRATGASIATRITMEMVQTAQSGHWQKE